jgi:replicative DNA helicase
MPITNSNISTGFSTLDLSWNYLKKGELVLICGRPSMGKTSFLINLGRKISLNTKVLVVSLETPFVSLIRKWPYINNSNFKNYLENFEIIDNHTFTIDELKQIILEKYSTVILIDGVDFLNIQINNFVYDIKKLANDLNVCILFSIQLGSRIEQRSIENLRPNKNDLIDRGFITPSLELFEKIVCLYRPYYYNIGMDDITRHTLEIHTYFQNTLTPNYVELYYDNDLINFYEKYEKK